MKFHSVSLDVKRINSVFGLSYSGGKDLMEAFGRSEELEETCKVAWMARNAGLLP